MSVQPHLLLDRWAEPDAKRALTLVVHLDKDARVCAYEFHPADPGDGFTAALARLKLLGLPELGKEQRHG